MKEDPQNNEEAQPDPRAGRDSLMSGFILVFAGFILLLNTLGFVDWTIWDILFRFWPVLLILWGIDLLLGATAPGNIASGVIAFLILLAVASYAFSSVDYRFGRWLKNRSGITLPSMPQNRIFIPPAGGGNSL